jgi:hypothetical protein
MKHEEQILIDLLNGKENISSLNEACFQKPNAKQLYLAMKTIESTNYINVCEWLIKQGLTEYVSFVLFLVQVSDERNFINDFENQCPFCWAKW